MTLSGTSILISLFFNDFSEIKKLFAKTSSAMAYAVIERDSDIHGRYDHLTLSAARIDNYFATIPPLFFQNKREEIWKIVFNGATSLQNIESAFTHLVNLEIVEFRNITVDQYCPVPSLLPDESPIRASRLVQLKFTSPCPDLTLSRSEHILIDWLVRRVDLPSLTSIEVTNSSRSRSRWQRSPAPPDPDFQNETMLKFGTSSYLQSSFILAQLMSKTAATLHDLKLSRCGFELLKGTDIESCCDLGNLAKVELKHIQFRIDSIGVDHLLKTQTKLENLTCDDIDDRFEEADEGTDRTDDLSKDANYQNLCCAFRNCVENCSLSLWSIKINRLVALKTELIDPVFDLSVFRNCSCLRYISIDNSRLKNSSFSGGHELPLSLTSLTIKVERVLTSELEALTSRIQYLESLRQLTVTSSVQYEVNLVILENILLATSRIGGTNGGLHDVELKNGRLTEDISAKRLQELLCNYGSNQQNRYWACEIKPKGILFEKWVTHRDAE